MEKFEVGIEKINYDAVEKSQSESKKFDAIDVGLWWAVWSGSESSKQRKDINEKKFSQKKIFPVVVSFYALFDLFRIGQSSRTNC